MDHLTRKRVVQSSGVLVAVLFAFLAPAGQAAPLTIVNVSAPDINCKFDSDCTITVSDFADHFTIGPTSGDAFLQSRRFPVGEPGTIGAGRYAYLYRLDLRNLVGLTALPCVNKLKITFGAVSQLDYNGDGAADDVFVVTSGGLGTVAPSSADKVGNDITFSFNPPVCAGSSPGNGESSYFFGLASTRPHRNITAQINDTLGGTANLEARAPQGFIIVWPIPGWLTVILAVVILGAIAAIARKMRQKQHPNRSS